MTLWDIYDAWTDTALDAPARDNGTHAERIEELIDYTDACSFRDCWDYLGSNRRPLRCERSALTN